MKWTLLACLDSENHPSLHKEVPQVSFPVKRTVVWPGIQGIRIALPIFPDFEILQSVQLRVG